MAHFSESIIGKLADTRCLQHNRIARVSVTAHAVESHQFTREGKSEHLLIAILRRTVSFQATGADNEQSATLIAGTKNVLSGLVGLLALDNLVQCAHILFAHAVRQALLGQAAIAARGSDFTDFM